MKKVFFSLCLCLAISFALFAQETLTITTYYPAPFGVYQRFVTQTLGVGDTNSSGGIDAADAPDHSDLNQQGQLWVANRVGISTTTPQNSLDVAGSAVIGENYAGVNIAPTSGLLVEGNVGIGTLNPQAKLDVDGSIKIGWDAGVCNSNKIGTLRFSSASGAIQYCDGSRWQFFSGQKNALARALEIENPSKWPDYIRCRVDGHTRLYRLHGIITKPGGLRIKYRSLRWSNMCRFWPDGRYDTGDKCGTCQDISIDDQPFKYNMLAPLVLED